MYSLCDNLADWVSTYVFWRRKPHFVYTLYMPYHDLLDDDIWITGDEEEYE